MAEHEPIVVTGDDILEMILESHLILSRVMELGLSREEQANAIEDLPTDKNAAIERLRQSIVSSLRGRERPKLTIIRADDD
jgi:hypothetical protein